MTDTTETKAADFTQSFDSRDWARAFVDIVHLKPGIPFDEGTMISWFANALMRGWDEHARRYPDAQEFDYVRQAVAELDKQAADGVPYPERENLRLTVMQAALLAGRGKPWVHRRADAWNPYETLFAFMGWLTSRRQRVTFSGSDGAAAAVELVAAFAKRHELSDPRHGWEKLIVPEKSDERVDLEAIKVRLSQVCYGHRWTEVLMLTEEIERLRRTVSAANVHSVDECATEHSATVAIAHTLTEAPNAEAQAAPASSHGHLRELHDPVQHADGVSAVRRHDRADGAASMREGAIVGAGRGAGAGYSQTPPGRSALPATIYAPIYAPIRVRLRALLERARPIVAEAIALSSEVRTPTFEMNNCLAAIDLALRETA